MSLFPYQEDKTREYIEDWLVIGPYRNTNELAEMSEDYLHGETGVVPKARDPRLAYKPWTPVTAPGGRFSFLSMGWPFTDYAVAYAHVYVHSLEAQDCKLIVGSDDGVTVFLNGKNVWVCDVNRAWNPEQDHIDVRLQQGWNRLMLKIRNGAADWVFSARFADSEGRPLKALDYRLDNPDPNGRFGIPMRYADLNAELINPQVVNGKIQAAIELFNLGDYDALDVCLLDGQCIMERWEAVTGGGQARTDIKLPTDSLAGVLSGLGLEIRWKTASELRRAPVMAARPIEWIKELGSAGVGALNTSAITEFAERAGRCVTMPDYGARLNGIAAEILASVNQPGPAAAAAKRGLELLKDISDNLSRATVHLVPQSHIDMAWLWDWRETVDVVFPLTFGNALDMIRRHPDFRFTQNQVLGLAVCERVYPDLFKEISQRIKEGRWETIGGQWLEPDSNMPNGESLARHLLWGQRYMQEKFGFTHKTAWCFDVFGHCWTLPQIFARAGIENYLFGRCGKGYPLFWWEGPDGSRILASQMRYGLPGDQIAEEAIRTIHDYNLHHMMFVFGGGDHGGGPDDNDMNTVRALQNRDPSPKVKISSGQAFFDAVRPEAGDLPVVAEELNFQFPGCWTSQADMKLMNRKLESLLYSAEVFSSVAALPDRGWRPLGYAKEELDACWRTLLLNQFHDILPGSGIHQVHVEARERYVEAIDLCGKVLGRSLQRIACAIDAAGNDTAIAVFNSMAWMRTDIVEAEVIIPASWRQVCVVDEDGRSHCAQIIGAEPVGRKVKTRIVFVARDVPAVGYKTFWVRKGKVEPEMKVTATRLAPENLSVSLDSKTGAIKSIRLRDREMLSGVSNVLWAHEDKPVSMAAWELGLTGREAPVELEKIEVIETGPVRGRVRVNTRFNRSRFTQDIFVYEGLERVDCRFFADWQETSVLLAAHFNFEDSADAAVYEIPYGHIQRRGTKEEAPALTWVDVPGDDFGFALLNDGRHGFSYKDGSLRMTVLRSPNDPDPQADKGEHHVGWSLLPHEGDFKKAQVLRRGHEFNNPMTALAVAPKEGGIHGSQSFLQLSGDNLALGCFKRAEGTEELIVRVVETMGQKTDSEIIFSAPILDAYETDIPELKRWAVDHTDHAVKFNIAPYQIRTFVVRMPRASEYYC